MLREVREQGLCFIVSHRRMDDDIVTLLPVHRRGDPVFITDLEGCYQGEAKITVCETIPYNQ
jgi:hypothetical protein